MISGIEPKVLLRICFWMMSILWNEPKELLRVCSCIVSMLWVEDKEQLGDYIFL